MRRSVRAASVFAVIAVGLGVLVASCGGGSPETIRIGVISDCRGPFAPYYEQSLAGAELAFIQRGARLRGPKPSDGVGEVSLGSKRVALVPGCETWGTPTTTLAEARRLVEQEGANAVVAPFWFGDGLLVRQYARVRPEIVFSDASTEPQTTLDRPAPNMFRFNLDWAQSIAGLGAYAYSALGWRKVVTFSEDDPPGWQYVSGFVAEFCSLGGNVVKRLWAPAVVRDWRPVVAQIPRAGVDGVLFASELQDPAGFFAAYGVRHPDLARRVVVSGLTLVHTSPLIPSLLGLVGSWDDPFGTTVAAWERYANEFQRTFKNPDGTILPGAAAVNFYNATEALLEALTQVHGDLSQHESRLMRALRDLQLDSPKGPIRLDSDQQAVGPAFLSRVQRDAQRRLTIQTFKVVPDVEQTFGGYLGAHTPAASETQPRCRHGNPPAWARSGRGP
ncbi:MAG: ABC transporter substrate-binding protein [Solirubrobacterales bacterium]|nr:ABC transporter substrate-binding protein [Solirubrobacterales bacterium]